MKRFIIVLLFICTNVFPLFAEERDITYADEKIIFTADFVEFNQKDNILIGRGNFHLIQEGAELRADEAEINLNTKKIVATGNVFLNDKGTELYGDEVHYNMETKKGKIIHGVVYQKPWIIYGPEMKKVNERKTVSRHARITSCDLTPPHYYLSTSKVFVYMDDYLFALNTAMWVDGVPIFYLPVFYKSLEERTFSLDIRPGYSKREGIQVKTTLGIPIGLHYYSKFYIDYYELKGIGLGTELNYFYENQYKGTLYGYTIKERDTLKERWNLRGAHWQRLTGFLIMQGNLKFQSDEDFNNTYFKESYDRVVQELESDLAFTAQTKRTTTRVVFRRDERYDALKGKFIPDKITAPNISFTTGRIEIGRSRSYYTVNAAFDNTYEKSDEFYRKSGNAGISLTRRFNLTRSTVYKPNFTYRELWRDRRSDADLHDLFNGSYTIENSLRNRVTRYVDVDVKHRYTIRTMNNTIKTDARTPDKGIARNHGDVLMYAKLGRIADMKILSGYDFHKNKGEYVETYKQKMDNVITELDFWLGKNTRVYFRNNYDFYPRTNVSFSGSVSTWNLKTNWSYLKSKKGFLSVFHTIAVNVTPKTSVNFGTRYVASGPNRMNYNLVEFTEQNLTIVRDLHCFEFRIAYIKRGKIEEITFNIQLKADMQRKKKLFNIDHEREFYPWRE